MKARSLNGEAPAFTMIELLVVIAIILALIVIAVPIKDRPRRSTIVVCMSNQRQLAIGQIMWASDHNDAFPWCIAVNKGGTRELTADGSTTPHFQVLSSYNLMPKLLICPSDTARAESANLTSLSNSNISYFVNLGSISGATTSQAQTILTGDRHLQVNGRPVKAGLLVPGANSAIEWTRELHAKNVKVPTGVLSFADGHGEAVKEKLTTYFQRQNQVTNRLAIP